MSRDSSRLILELDKQRSGINRHEINPTLAEVDIDTILPVIKVCAKARAKYMACLMEIANSDTEENCNPEQIEQLKQCRLTYEELVSAANALETVVKRGYVDVKEK